MAVNRAQLNKDYGMDIDKIEQKLLDAMPNYEHAVATFEGRKVDLANGDDFGRLMYLLKKAHENGHDDINDILLEPRWAMQLFSSGHCLIPT